MAPPARLGAWVFGLSAVLVGGAGVVWRDFTEPWLPAPVDGPARAVLAVAFSLLLILGGVALAGRRFARRGGLLLALAWLLPMALWALRIVHYPRIIGTWLGLAEEAAVFAGAVMAAALAATPPRMAAPEGVARAAALAFGVCCLCFGAAHFVAMKETAGMVPAWMPLGGRAWAMITGAADILAGLAILSGVRAWLAAQLVALMFAIFGLLIWLPMLVAKPGVHMNWGGFGITFLLVGAALLTAEAAALRPALQRSGRRRRHR